jgi:hypothetical protein
VSRAHHRDTAIAIRGLVFLNGTLVQVAGCLSTQGKHRMSFSNRTDMYRMKALVCEQRATESSDPTSKLDWEELAIEWHTMANFAARASGESVVVEMV